MAELVGGALLSSFISVLFDRLAPQEVLINLFRRKKVIPETLYELKITLLAATKLLNDAEEKHFMGQQEVKIWLDELMDVVYEADHVLDKINTEALRLELEQDHDESIGSKACKCFNLVSTPSTDFDIAIKSGIEKILSKLKLLLDPNQIVILGLNEVHDPKTSFLSKRLPAPWVEKNDVLGREADRKFITKSLLSDDIGGRKISVISIVGLGGIGKTTLAQLIYKDKEVQEHFEFKIWVTVSEDFDVPRITGEILKAVNSKDHRIEDLKEALMGKKFMLVLDDVWNEDYQSCNLLQSSLESGARGSRILVTTRSQIVTEKMRSDVTHILRTISNHDCLQLLAKHVFDDHEGFGAHLDLQEIGLGIVEKCKGLPLAVKSIAGLLHPKSTTEEWNSILNSDVWELQFQENQKNNIPPALWLSYRFLPSKLKLCFSYCSIFPKDYEFNEYGQERIISLWMAEGHLQPERGKPMEKVGEEYLNALISRSFFQQSSEKKKTLVMHDLVHDLAMRISGEFCCVLEDYKDQSKLPTKTRHLSYQTSFEDNIKLVKGLRTLVGLSCSDTHVSHLNVPENVLHGLLPIHGECLRALTLSQFFIEELPKSIGNLKHLRYLNLSWLKMKKLPNSICTLYNLQTLLLSYCEELTQLPSNISNLICLRHLNFRGTSKITEMPRHMCNMTNLQSLSDFILGENDGSRIKELEKLQLSRGSLRIMGVENVVDVVDVQKANLKMKKGLNELILIWNRSTSADSSTREKAKEVLDALEPDTSYLKKLEIIGYKGTKFSDWVGHHSYRNIVNMTLDVCGNFCFPPTGEENCCLLPSFGQLSSLKELTIAGFDQVMSIGDEFSGTSSLERLYIRNMNFLEEWSFTEANQEGGLTFPRLKKLDLFRCSKLEVGLPAIYLPSLKKIDIIACEGMVAVFPTNAHQQISTTYPALESLSLNS